MSQEQLTKKVTLFEATILAALMAGFANLILFYFEKLVGLHISIPAGTNANILTPLTLGRVLMATLTPAFVGGIVFAIVQKFSPRTVRSFFILSIGFLIFSFGAPLALPQPISAKIGLILMHIVAAIFILGTFYSFQKQSK